MKNILKVSLLTTMLFITFLFGAISVSALDVYFVEHVDTVGQEGGVITEFDFGTVVYHDDQRESFRIKNATTSEVTITDMKFTDSSMFELYDTPASKIAGNDSIKITIISKEELDASTTVYEDTLTFKANGEDVSFPVKIMVEPYPLSKPKVVRDYGYNGYSQTFFIEGYLSADMTYTGPKEGTEMGDYNIVIGFNKVPGNYVWKDGTTDDVSLTVKIVKGYAPDPSYERNAGIGEKLSSIELPTGWTWDDPDTLILEDRNDYPASYVDSTGYYNNESARGLAVYGIKQHTVTLPTNSNVITNPSESFKMLDSQSETVSLVAEDGYLFTSIKVNGVEMISSKLDSYDYAIRYIHENVVIEAITERIVFNSIGDEILKFVTGTEDSLSFEFDYDFTKFGVANIRLNGNDVSKENIEKYFKFSNGSVIMEVSSEYLNTLEPGTYDVEIDATSGELFKTSFLVEQGEVTINPETGDNVVIYIIMAGIALAGITGSILYKKKFNN